MAVGLLLALGQVDAGPAQGPVLRRAAALARLRAAGDLFAQAEQAVLAGRQAEARQGHRVDLLLGQVRR